MSKKIPLTVEQAKQAGLQPAPEGMPRPEGGLEFDAQNDGDICYISPCANHVIYIYYWINNQCVLGFYQPC